MAVPSESRWKDASAVGLIFFLPIVIILLAAFLVPRVPAAQEGYPFRPTLEFQRACESMPGNSARDCRCMVRELEARVPLERFREEEIRILLGRPGPDVAAALEPCGP